MKLLYLQGGLFDCWEGGGHVKLHQRKRKLGKAQLHWEEDKAHELTEIFLVLVISVSDPDMFCLRLCLRLKLCYFLQWGIFGSFTLLLARDS